MEAKLNRGEWSELYVLFRLVADGKLSFADNMLQPLGQHSDITAIHWTADT